MNKLNDKEIYKVNPLMVTNIAIIIFMILIPIIFININEKEYKSYKKEEVNTTMSEQVNNEIIIDNNNKISVYITLEDRIEDDVCGVVANEMQSNFKEETLKAQAIASRTYMIGKKLKRYSADIYDPTHCQVYTSKEKVFNKWGEVNSRNYWDKIKLAVDETKGQVVTYEGEIVLYPVFFSISSGMTESSIGTAWNDIPYIKSVESFGEEIAPKYTSDKEMALSELVLIINN